MKCLKCKGVIQATRVEQTYFTFDGTQFNVAETLDGDTDWRFYCQNDCRDPFDADTEAHLLEIATKGQYKFPL